MPTAYVDTSGTSHPNIQIEGDNAFVLEVTGALRMIHGVDRQDVLGSRCSNPGPRLILGLSRSAHTVRINNGGTFKATASGNTDDQYVKLRREWSAGHHAAARAEFQRALPQAGFPTVELFANRLAGSGFAITDRAFTPADLHGKSADEIQALVGGKAGPMLTPDKDHLVDPSVAKKWHTSKSARATNELANRQSNADQWVAILKSWSSGTGPHAGYVPHALALGTMLRLLEPGLTASAGADAGVMYAPQSKNATCTFDSAAAPRPKEIAFAHELIHAYYIVKGSRIFPESTIEDEMLTAGMAPFHMRDLTENRFRANWSTQQPIRQYYKFGTIALETACAFCGKAQSAMTRGNRGFETNCAQCGKPLPTRTQ
jgi:hypothetical protein